MSAFSERVAGLRAQKGMNKAAFATFLGFAPGVYQRYENGRIPAAEHLSVIADACNVTVDYLLGRTDDPGPGATGAPIEAPPEATIPAPDPCRIPETCDLPARLDAMETAISDVSAKLAGMQIKIDTLVSLLGAATGAGLDAKRKAG